MKTTTKLRLLAATAVMGFLTSGCDRDAAPVSERDDSVIEPGAVELTPAHWQLEDGETATFDVTYADGTTKTHRYRYEGGALLPMGDAPDLGDLDPESVNYIPVSIDEDGSYTVSTTSGERSPGDSVVGDRDWVPRERELMIPALEVDATFRVDTGSFVEDIKRDGRTVIAQEREWSGASQAEQVTRVTIEDFGMAEVYQFDDPLMLEHWYRVAYQLHMSADHDPAEHIRVEGLTMLRTAEPMEEALSSRFHDAQRLNVAR